VQVKTRDRRLRFSDLNGVLPRFALLRREHTDGRRPGVARFVVVSNTRPGPDLEARLGRSTWPADVAVLWPGGPNTHVELQLPAPWPDLDAAMRACVSQASSVPFPSLSVGDHVIPPGRGHVIPPAGPAMDVTWWTWWPGGRRARAVC
jgi:hypothetical protein